MHKPIQFLALLAAVASTVGAQQPPVEDLQRAGAAFARGDWAAARAGYEAIASAHPQHALSRFRLGVALLELGNLPEAEKNLRLGERLGIPAPQAAYRLAQLFAVRGSADSAVAKLARAAETGLLVSSGAVRADPHFTSIKNHPRWQQIVDAFDANVFPCRHDGRFREFDFWIGDWDVRPTGQPPTGPAARNTVTLDDNDCVITEHWSAPSGSTGQSFNIFDRSYGVWRQTWVDNSGGQHDYRGHLVGRNMVFTGDTPQPNGHPGRVPTRLTFFNLGPDSVRQFSETSSDSGRTWQVSYDLMYVRRHASDHAQIRALDSTFVAAWLRDDTTRVLALFTDDAVLMPPNATPITGRATIRSWWWPADGSHTRILSFDRHIEEIGERGDVAFVRATSALQWSYVKDGKTTMQSSRSADLVLLTRDQAGNWKIARQMWTNVP